ncbi:hypothetical protein COB21_03630, partial [Candidatus Aerophobetes bacterium]
MTNRFFLMFFLSFFSISNHLYSSPTSYNFPLESPSKEEDGISVQFEDINAIEFLRFVSKVACVNFIYDEEDLDFNINLVTGKPTTKENLVAILIKMFEKKSLITQPQDGCLVITKNEEQQEETTYAQQPKLPSFMKQVSSNTKADFIPAYLKEAQDGAFHVLKLQYHEGKEIIDTIKNVSMEMTLSKGKANFAKAIRSMQWISSTNSILYSGTPTAITQLTQLIKTLDVQKKQVFIEVLVVETDVKNGLDFGLDWGGNGVYKNKTAFSAGNFPPGGSSFADAIKGVTPSVPPNPSNIPMGTGFDLGIIGDLIMHKGQSYLTLGSLVSALQRDGNSTIVLNQKILAQDNKESSIFVGDNLPFTGSVVQTIGASQQTSANIEYRDVGVKLSITPLVGDGDVITLSITEQITEAMNDIIDSTTTVNGIKTTKTNMSTQVHVPDKSFLFLSGMIRNTKKNKKSGLPCLGGLPLIGAAFSQNKKEEEKRNIIVFVRPQIIHSVTDHQIITTYQEKQFKQQTPDKKAFDDAINPVKQEGS